MTEAEYEAFVDALSARTGTPRHYFGPYGTPSLADVEREREARYEARIRVRAQQVEAISRDLCLELLPYQKEILRRALSPGEVRVTKDGKPS